MHTALKMTAAAALTVLAAMATPAAAVSTTFATFSPKGGGANIRWTNVGGNRNAAFYTTAKANSTVPGSIQVFFNFLQPGIGDILNNVPALFTLNGSVTNTAATVSGATLTQSNLAGSFSFLTTAPITVAGIAFAKGANLLSGTFTGAEITGNRNGNSATFAGSAPGSITSFTSDFLDFVGGAKVDFSFAVSSIAPTLNALPVNGTPARALRGFRGVAGGTFSSDPAPSSFVPEPESWAMLLAGFAMIGVSLRSRRRSPVAA
ncbi:MAG: PEPxxWA-CTERM sorting domain-containing protein [Sphingomonadales bacterium]|jgi:hypothetical protein